MTLTWNGGPTNDPPPKSVVIVKRSTASWNGGSGTASNGLGDPYVASSGSGYSDGVEYELVNGSPTTITRTISPSASSSVSGADEEGALSTSASVSVSVEAAPLVLTLAGTSPSTGNADLGSPPTPNAVMIGQRVRGGISCDFATLTNHNWTVPGDVFASFDRTGYYYNSVIPGPAFTGGHRSNLALGELQGHSPEWVWAGSSSTYDARTVSCSVTVETSEGPIGTGSAELTAYVFAPYTNVDQIKGSHADSFIGSPATNIRSAPNGDVAVFFRGGTGTPFFACQSGDSGGWNFAQTLSVSRHFYAGNGAEGDPFVCPRWWLDNTFPYSSGPSYSSYPNNDYNVRGGTQWDADITNNVATSHYTVDTPGHGIISTDRSFSIEDEYRMYHMYQPPNNGLGSEYVPIKRFDWKWNSSASYSGNVFTGTWSPDPSGAVTVYTPSQFPPHPYWTGCLENR